MPILTSGFCQIVKAEPVLELETSAGLHSRPTTWWELTWGDICTRKLVGLLPLVCLQGDTVRKIAKITTSAPWLKSVILFHSGRMFAVPLQWVVWWPFADLPVKLDNWGCGVTAVHIGLSVDGLLDGLIFPSFLSGAVTGAGSLIQLNANKT